ncbi:septal ring lytic transglycosylase RlpA family protein [Sphingobium mellinum]|uniref:septal ring lytic transglycosylase RlpA family protein n=1 Tax=Sphingobium mellinum TaxID=1387166 RepID=UPI0030EBAE3C
MTFPFRLAPLAGLLVAGCASYQPVTDNPVRIGPPYKVRGVTYVPADQPNYDAVGYASWYGNESGDRTARGEKFRPRGISAAHPTLPLPSYVEVTDLANGRTALVRVNDRGPFVRGRIIDLSRGAARLLGVERQSPVAVRVRRVDPPEQDRKRLRKGKPAAERPPLTGDALAAQRARLALPRGSGTPSAGLR